MDELSSRRGPVVNVVLASALAGMASGGRTFTPLAVLSLVTPDGAVTQPDRTLRRGQARAVITVAAAGELVGDKLPNTPSRLEPAPLVGRTLAGAACAVILARRSSPGRIPHSRIALCTAAGAVGGVAGSYLGSKFRRRAAAQFGVDWPGALIEDALTITTAVLAAR